MAVPGREQIREAILQYVELPGARFLRALKLTPNAVTLIGFGFTVAAAYFVGSGWLLAGGIVFLLGSGLDLMDGALARLTGTVNPFGALLDSVFDRLGEAALFVGLAFYALRSGFSDSYLLIFIIVLFLALIFSQGVSYLRARGEGLGVFSRAGLMTRTERVILLGIGLLIGQIFWVLLLIAAVSCFTLFQRMFTIRRELNQGG
ncbi:MAG TPA: CDP-alcohol phosphatidyltransferase family protein [Dehalococcoidia bacterium]|jgi:phosphatidylglycerophosphate synthase|nr:CDP-alcohol phosphatidyltransferase family protein [Dehalococcoidia bacterium]